MYGSADEVRVLLCTGFVKNLGGLTDHWWRRLLAHSVAGGVSLCGGFADFLR